MQHHGGLGAVKTLQIHQGEVIRLFEETPVRLRLKDNAAEVERDLDKLAKGVSLAIAISLTKTAKLVQAAEREEMERVFDRPTPFTLNSLFIVPATPEKPEAEVYIKSEARKGHSAREYLVPELEGGVRAEKRSEAALRHFGILPAGMSAVPGAAANLDAYGNMSKGQIQQILSALRASEQFAGHTSDRPLDKRRQRRGLPQFFVAGRDGRTRHLHPGVWLREGRAVHPVLMFVRQPSYKQRLDFERVGNETADKYFPGILGEQLAITARKNGR